MTSQTSDGETIGNRERSRAIARREPGRKQVLSSAAGRIYASQVSTGEYTRPSVRSAVGTARSACRSDRPRRAPSAFNSGESRIVNRESRARRNANGDASAILRWGRKDRGPCLGYISHWRIRITGKWSRFVMTFVVSSVYFDISLGRGEHRSMKYERVPRDFHDGFLTSVLIQL